MNIIRHKGILVMNMLKNLKLQHLAPLLLKHKPFLKQAACKWLSVVARTIPHVIETTFLGTSCFSSGDLFLFKNDP